ncbi:protein NRT1/PTR FAMILY 1.2-like [Gossypium australe]|uniref:Protein NRT1/PTR FAMILY 1.2-like n=1 Tax=Gossypium australe TaxID=47621 RepID=A0A5B6VGS6_9ROSI|nr:protein NRT1/PTR FAMILY 1.2-like [Gossypium australe]
MILLWSTAIIPQARPYCDQFNTICEAPATPQLLLLYCSLGLISIGAGGIRSSCMAFGADQLDKRNNPENTKTLQSFFGWYYATVTFSALIAVTLIVYVQDNLGWGMGFGIPVMLMFGSAVSFFLASSFYIKLKAKTSLLTGLAQVIVASFRNRHIELPSHATNEVYHIRKGSMLQVPSEKLRFLNKSCVIKDPQEDLTSNGDASNPWSLCTVDQVEDLKALIRVMPLCSAGIMMSVNVYQGSFMVIQAGTMDRHVTPNFEIPAGSFSMFMMISIVVWIPFYDRIVLPLASKIKGKPVRLGLKQRMGIGLLCSGASMVASAIVEYTRRKIVIEEGLTDEPPAVVHMSALWILPFYILGGLAEAFNGIGQIEFCYSELPKTMSTIAANIYGFGTFISNLVASFITSMVDNVTKRGGESWISSNMNKGHYDYYYCLLAGLSMLNFIYFLACCKAYGPCHGDNKNQAEKSKKGDYETMIPQARPYCDQFNTICEAPTTTQLLLLYCSLGLISMGAGGVKSSCMAFSADQLEERNKLAEFLQLVLCYINVCSSNRSILFFLASSFYIKLKARASLLTACMIKNPQEDLTSNGAASNPWSLCTIEQVEDLKALIGVMPLCFAGIMPSITVNQGQFMGRIAIPLASKIKGKPVCLGLKQRMGIGLLCSCASMVSSACRVCTRRKIAIEEGLSDEPQAVVQMSALWILSFYVLAALAEAFSGIGQIEFCYSELPKTMSTIAAKVNGFGAFLGNPVASLIISLVDNVTKRGGETYGPCHGDNENQAENSGIGDHESINQS